ncbi:hypothetical protein LguiB_008914 [Lonicera macranthoides]
MASTSKIRMEQKVEANGFSKYEKCINDLQNMEELNKNEILKSLSILRDEKNAIAFLKLKGPLRLAFLSALRSGSKPPRLGYATPKTGPPCGPPRRCRVCRIAGSPYGP